VRDLAEGPRGRYGQRLVGLDRIVDFCHGQDRVAIGVRHVRIVLGDHQPAPGTYRLDGGGQDVDLDPE
jgi:hypothetical protein